MERTREQRLDELIDDFVGIDWHKQQAAEEELVAIGKPAVSRLIGLQIPETHRVWSLLFQMPPEAYAEIFPLLEEESDQAAGILRAVERLDEPPVGIVPHVVDALGTRHRLKCLAALAALFHLHQKTVTDAPQVVESLQAGIPKIIDRLGSADAHVRRGARKCVGALKPPASVAVPALLSAIEKSREQRTTDFLDAVDALAVYGADPRVVPAIMGVIEDEGAGHSRFRTLRALVHIGEPALQTLPALECLLDQQTQEPTRKGLRRAIKALKQIETPPRKRKRKGDAYLIDLVERMEDDSDQFLHSKAETTRAVARREAEQLSDPSLVPSIEELLGGELKKWETVRAFDLLRSLVRNTDSEDAKRLLVTQLQRDDLDKDQIAALLGRLESCPFPEASPVIQELMSGEQRPFAIHAFGLLGALKDPSSVDCIVHAAQFEKDKSHAVFALQEIGGTAALEALKVIATTDEHAESRWRAVAALAEIGTGDPSVPALIHDQLRGGRSRFACVYGLGLLAYQEAFPEVLTHFRDGIDASDLAASVGPKYGTRFATCLNYFVRTDQDQRPEVLELLRQLAEQDKWELLRPEEKAFLAKRYGIGGQEPEPQSPDASPQQDAANTGFIQAFLEKWRKRRQ